MTKLVPMIQTYIIYFTNYSESKREQAICYITALQWILDYYYRGVQSWDWYYPHHYAPFISDLTNFKDYKIKLNLGEPFLPFEQVINHTNEKIQIKKFNCTLLKALGCTTSR